MSLPEAAGRTAHFGAGIAAVGATLAAGYAVARYRQGVSAAHGWGSFTRDDPWPLIVLTLDELNLILAEEVADDIPKEFKQWVLGLISKFQITGRKVGMGIRFAAQGIHSADLGDKVKLRANAKTGAVWLGRTTSGTTANMATEGVVPPGVDLLPIPPVFGGADDIDAAFRGEVKPSGPTTAGMANLIREGTVTRMRVWRAVKDETKQYSGLIALYESAPVPHLTPEEREVFDTAYSDALARADHLLNGGKGDDEDLDDEDLDDDGPSYDPLDAILNPGGRPAPPTVPDQIRDTLHTHGPMKLADIRAALPHIAPGTIGNAVTSMTEAGHLVRAGRGVYALPT